MTGASKQLAAGWITHLGSKVGGVPSALAINLKVHGNVMDVRLQQGREPLIIVRCYLRSMLQRMRMFE